MRKETEAKKILVATVLASLVLLCLAPIAASAGDKIQDRYATAQLHLQQFNASRSIDDLTAAVDAMNNATDVDALTPSNFIAQRRTVVQGWAKILKAIEQNYDPSFDPAARIGCPDPPQQTGTSLLPCSDPQAIRDPEARAAYAAKLAAFQRHNQQAARYWALRRVDDRAMTILQMSLKFFRDVAPESATADFAALDAILQQEGISGSRRSAIDALFYARAGRAP